MCLNVLVTMYRIRQLVLETGRNPVATDAAGSPAASATSRRPTYANILALLLLIGMWRIPLSQNST